MRRVTVTLSLFLAGLREGYRRIAYLTLTLIVATTAWLALAAMASPFLGGGGFGGNGITITNGSQSNGPLPLRYARRIEAVPGARDVAWITMQLVNCGAGAPALVAISAYGGPGTDAILATQHHVDAALLARWNKDPDAIIIASQSLGKCGWHVGESITPPSMMGKGKHVALHIAGTFRSKHGGQALAHYDYINRVGSMFGKDMVFAYRTHAANAHANNVLAARIDAAFAHDFPTVDAATDATAQNALSRFGKVQQLLVFVMVAILLCAASVLVSVLAHYAAERRRKFALMQALGFRRDMLFAAFALEALCVLVAGAAIGTAIGSETVRLPLFGNAIVMSSGFTIPPWAFYWIPAWLAALLVLALVWPATLIARVKPSDYRAV